jgi:hypothetical protein
MRVGVPLNNHSHNQNRINQAYDKALWWLADHPTICHILAFLVMVIGFLIIEQRIRAGTFFSEPCC